MADPSVSSVPSVASSGQASRSGQAPGYVPSISAAGEEDPGATIDAALDKPPQQARHADPASADPASADPAQRLPTLKIDFVSDISCPWCAIGLAALEQALDKLKDDIRAEIHFQPFELTPRMAPGGQDITEHLTQKYGSTPEQQSRIRDTIRQRGAELGVVFNPEGRGRIYNTFDAHRLLHWAGVEQPAKQAALKKALLLACHRDRQAMDTHDTLLAAVRDAGMDVERAWTVLQSDAYAEQVRLRQDFYTSQGIRSVPAVVINDRHLISGGQPVAVFEQALRDIAAESLKP